MNKFKVLLLICALLLLSGCTIEANIDMNPHGKVKEEIKINESVSNIGGSKEKAELYISQVLEKYNIAFDSRGYEYKTDINSKNGTATITNTFDSINNYFEDTIFSQYVYRQMKWVETDDYYEIYNVTDHIAYCADCSDWPALPLIKVNIKLPIPAVEQNADEVNGTTYTWIYDKNTPTSKKFYLKISKDDLKQNEIVYNAKVKRNNTIKKIVILTVVLLAVVGIAILIYRVYKRVQENNSDY